MPRLDGYEATRRIRARGGRRVPVLAMTAAAIEGERERCLAAGMDDFLTKPVDPDALAAALTRWLTRSRSTTPLNVPTPVGPLPGPGGTDRHDGVDGDGRLLDRDRLDMLRDMAPGETSYLDRAIGNFASSSADSLSEVRGAVAEGDAGRLRAAAHKLAGTASNLGVVVAADLARELELLADDGTTSGAESLVARLSEAVEAGQAALVDYRAAYGRA